MLDQDSTQAIQALHRFVEAMQRRRAALDMSTKKFAGLMKFDPSYVSHIERHRHRPTRSFAFRADQALGAKGQLFKLYEEYETLRDGGRGTARPTARRADRTILVNEHEHAEQHFDGEHYTMILERALFNGTSEPIIHYPMKITLDEASTEPLEWDDVQLTAHCGDQPMDVQRVTDWHDYKEAFLLFRNASCRFPLQPGQRETIRYSYRVPAHKWGQWFQRAISCYTDELTVKLVFPLEFGPIVWGSEVSSEGKPPLRLIEQDDEAMAVRIWQRSAPTLGARYRFEWSLTGRPAERWSSPAGTGRAER